MSKRFVYGKFHWPSKERELEPLPRPPFVLPGTAKPTAWDQVALEVLREYGANELIGKIYFKGNFNQWVPAEPSQVTDLEWFKWYLKLPTQARDAKHGYYFDMVGSGRWEVLHFRNESDETGPYVAMALRFR